MQHEKYEIRCHRSDGKILIDYLRSQEDIQIDAKADTARLEGAVDTLSIIASMSAIAANAFLVWVAANPRLKRKTEIKKIDSDKD